MGATLPCAMHLSASAVSPMAVSFLALFLAVVCVAVVLIRQQQRNARLPPGPVSHSWFESVDLPKSYQWITYAKWSRFYGDIIYIRKFGNPMIVLNSAKAVNDLLEKRSAIYSSRPRRVMVSELIGFTWLFSTMPYGLEWKKHRALFHQHFHPNDLSSIHPVIARETDVLLSNLLEYSGSNLFHQVRRSGAAMATMISYGHQIAPEGDQYVSIADKALTGLATAGLFGTYLVDYMSFLKHVPSWIPGAKFKRQALEWRKASQAMVNMPFEMVKQRMAAGTAIPCFTTTQLEQLWLTGSDPQEEKVIKNVAATVFAAGADTTVSAILSFFLAMLAYPEIQAKAQAEIDRVIGSSRLPTFEDRNDLPYIDCIVWECLRWIPVTPLGVARSVIQDDEYRGYHIPKGTTVLPNVWAILHEESMYPEPSKFDPDRFADEKRNAELGINEVPIAAFGFGRRVCPGRWVAVEAIWLTVATVLAAFNVVKARDEKGQVIEPDMEPTSSMLSRPKPFQCSITPRSEMAAVLVRQRGDEQGR